MQVIEHFTCEAANLLDTFEDDMTEPEWRANGDAEARQRHLIELQSALDAEGRSLSNYEITAPPAQPPDEPLVQPHFVNGSIHLNPDQQAPFDAAAAHLERDNPEGALLMHLEGEPGGGKTTFLNCLLNHARSRGRVCLPAAFPAKVARKFRGGQTAHYWLGMNSSKPGFEVTLGVAAPDDFSAGVTPAHRRRGARLLAAGLLFIDQITMMRAEQLDALVRLLLRIGFVGAAPACNLFMHTLGNLLRPCCSPVCNLQCLQCLQCPQCPRRAPAATCSFPAASLRRAARPGITQKAYCRRLHHRRQLRAAWARARRHPRGR